MGSAVVIKIRNPNATAIIFRSGKVNVAGTKSLKETKLAARKFARIIQKAGFQAKFKKFSIKTVNGVYDVGHWIHLEGVAKEHQDKISYEPELFPGLIFRLQEPKVSVVLFMGGKVTFMGAKNRKQMLEAFKIVGPIIEKYRR